MSKRPEVNSYGQKELDKAEKQFENFDNQIKEMTHDRLNAAPKPETEAPKLSQRELEKNNAIYLKPLKTINSTEPFNEKFRADYEYAKEYVNFIAQNNEVIGEDIEQWTKKFPGQPAEFWKVPVNKPVWGPRYLAERIKDCSYHRLRMDDKVITNDHGFAQEYGTMVVDKTVQRLDAHPVSDRKSIFTGAQKF